MAVALAQAFYVLDDRVPSLTPGARRNVGTNLEGKALVEGGPIEDEVGFTEEEAYGGGDGDGEESAPEWGSGVGDR